MRMKKEMLVWFVGLASLALAVGMYPGLGMASESEAGGVMEKISINGVAAGAYQYLSVDNAPDYEDTGRGAFAFQPEISFALTEQDTFFAKFGFGAGDGLNDGSSPFVLAPWAADLEGDVKDISGRNRDYLLTAWYMHTFDLGSDSALGVTGGILDATDYLDENAYSNDEFTQFMNEALVNGPNAFLPSYDLGGALDLTIGNLGLKGVVMNVAENDDGRNFNFYGFQAGYAVETGLGEGNYRLIFNRTSEDFSSPSGDQPEALQTVLLSFDQELGDILGAWIRFGWQDDSAAITYENVYSGGINISGALWGREQDNIGIGYATLSGADQDGQDVDNSQVLEAYARFPLNEYFALTGDLQFLKDDMKEGEDPKGWIGGLRLVAEF